VLVGVILALLAAFLALPMHGERGNYSAPLVGIAIGLIGIGVLLGRTKIS